MSGSREKINFAPLRSARADGSSWNTIIGPDGDPRRARRETHPDGLHRLG